MNASGKWPGTIVTEVTPAADFWDAEEEHQNYLKKTSPRLYLSLHTTRVAIAAISKIRVIFPWLV
jgi:peptide methionine sulfoxide reductase MsrA